MRVKASKIIATGKKYVGVEEKPSNSNNVIFNTHFYGHSVKGSAYPWCCAFVWDIFRMSGASSIFCDGKKLAYCPSVENYYKRVKRWHSSGKKGDLILMDFGKGRASHIGICLGKEGEYYLSLEGNTSVTSNDNGGKVMIRKRKKNVIRGFARPDYLPEKKKTVKYYPKCNKKETSFVEGLQYIKVDSSFNSRKKIAKANGIGNYMGTAGQNIKLLGLLKNGKLKK